MMNRRDELKQEYQESTEKKMGVYAIRERAGGQGILGISLDVPALFNRTRFELSLGSFRHRVLQEAWTRGGPEALSFEVLDTLPPSKEPRANPKEELRVLESLWRERLEAEGVSLESAS